MTDDFAKYLRKQNLSDSTVKSYLYAVRQFDTQHGAPTKKNLREHREWLIQSYRPRTVNLRLRAVNCYLESIGKEKWKLKFIRVQQKPFAENVISEADYAHLKNSLKRDGEWAWYFIVRFFAATGVRVNELTKIKVEDVKLGHMELYSKGGKVRRIYIPKCLQEETLSWLGGKHQDSGFLFLNKYGAPISPRGISGQLKKFAARYNIDPDVVYPHSFRHRFAKNFMERSSNIAFLADLMGHENIETTRVYLRKTGAEQKELVDRTVDW